MWALTTSNIAIARAAAACLRSNASARAAFFVSQTVHHAAPTAMAPATTVAIAPQSASSPQRLALSIRYLAYSKRLLEFRLLSNRLLKLPPHAASVDLPPNAAKAYESTPLDRNGFGPNASRPENKDDSPASGWQASKDPCDSPCCQGSLPGATLTSPAPVARSGVHRRHGSTQRLAAPNSKTRPIGNLRVGPLPGFDDIKLPRAPAKRAALLPALSPQSEAAPWPGRSARAVPVPNSARYARLR